MTRWPTVRLILCAGKDSYEAHRALEGSPHKGLAAESKTVLPDGTEGGK